MFATRASKLVGLRGGALRRETRPMHTFVLLVYRSLVNQKQGTFFVAGHGCSARAPRIVCVRCRAKFPSIENHQTGIRQANRGMGGVSIEDAFAARAQHAASKQQQQRQSGGGGGDGGGDFASDAMARHFEGLMTILCLLLSAPTTDSTKSGQHGAGGVDSGIDGASMGDVGGRGGSGGEGSGGEGLEHHSVPPDLVRRGLLVLEAAHKGRGLFRFPPFASFWLPPMLTDALKGLTDGVHPLLKEEVGALVFDMAEVRGIGGIGGGGG